MVVASASLNFRVQTHKRAEVLSAAEALVRRMRTVPGCTRSLLLADVEDPSSLTLASEWSDSRSAEAYFQSHELHSFLALRILLREEPFIVFDEIGARVTRPVRERRG
jgi:quinol monooxygenase YgiN